MRRGLEREPLSLLLGMQLLDQGMVCIFLSDYGVSLTVCCYSNPRKYGAIIHCYLHFG